MTASDVRRPGASQHVFNGRAVGPVLRSGSPIIMPSFLVVGGSRGIGLALVEELVSGI